MKIGSCRLTSAVLPAILGLAILAAPAITFAAPLQAGSGMDKNPQTMPSPPAKATVVLNGKSIVIDYNTPHMRGRKIFGGILPYGKVWRTGANPATSFKTAGNLKIGDVMVPAGSYTLYTIPSQTDWKLIINKQTGQWGTQYDQSQDLARIPMVRESLPKPQEVMSISFEKTHDNTTQLHVKWETTDVFVEITGQ